MEKVITELQQYFSTSPKVSEVLALLEKIKLEIFTWLKNNTDWTDRRMALYVGFSNTSVSRILKLGQSKVKEGGEK